MQPLFEVGLSNALAATLLAAAALVVSGLCRRPAVVHGLWLLVLLKLITPPLVSIPLPWPAADEPSPAAAPAPAPLVVGVLRQPAEDAEESTEPAAGIALLTNSDLSPGITAETPPVEAATIEDNLRPPAANIAMSVPWRTAVAVVWVAGSVGWLALALVRVWRFQRMLRHARPAPRALR